MRTSKDISRLTHFTDFGLNASILRSLTEKGYTQPTPIQAEAIPGVMAGRDLLGIAQTGTGKTAAFALPILHRLAADRKAAPRKGCRALVLSPTRELATQIADSFRAYGSELGFSVATIFGGVAHGPQRQRLDRGVDILVATPGRLLDHIDEGTCKLSTLEIFVLDEADQMLDMGFIVPIRKVVKTLPKVRQNLFFSATMPQDIGKLAGELLNDPLRVSVTPESTTAERVNQQVILVETMRKRGLLVELFRQEDFTRVLVFTRTKHGADRVARILEGAGIAAAAIHGNKSQNQREKALAMFKSGEVRALVATDIAARGIDVSAVSHVVQYDLPEVPEQYVHRIGRTARAGADGSAVAFCGEDERQLLKDIEKKTRQKIWQVNRMGDKALGELSAGIVELKRPREQDPRAVGRGGRDGQRQNRGNGGGNGGGRGGQNRSAQGRSEQGRSEQGRGEQPRVQQARTEQPRREGARDEPRAGARPDNRNKPAGKPGEGRRAEGGNRNGNGSGNGGDRNRKPGPKGPAGQRSGRPGNVFANSGAATGGPVRTAADVMRHLGAANPWSDT